MKQTALRICDKARSPASRTGKLQYRVPFVSPSVITKRTLCNLSVTEDILPADGWYYNQYIKQPVHHVSVNTTQGTISPWCNLVTPKALSYGVKSTTYSHLREDGFILSYPHRWRVVWYSDRMSQVSTHLDGLSRGKTKRWHESPISPSWTIEHWIFQFLILRGWTNHIRSVQTWDPVPGRSTHPQPVVCHTVVATTEASKELCKELLKLRRSALRQWVTLPRHRSELRRRHGNY